MASKKIFITGSSKGLGYTLAKSFLEQGDAVYGCARTGNERVEALKHRYSNEFHFFNCDLGSEKFLKTIHSNVPIMDGLDGVVFNAAIGVDGLLASMSTEQIKKCVDVNLTSTILLAREVIKGMLLNGGGKLIFISSVAAKTGFNGLSVYAATKAGLLGFSKTLAREYGSKGIRSNVILPGFLETEMSSGLHQQQMESIRRRIPVGELGQPNDVVGIVQYLISEEANYVNGAEIVVDGGMSA